MIGAESLPACKIDEPRASGSVPASATCRLFKLYERFDVAVLNAVLQLWNVTADAKCLGGVQIEYASCASVMVL